jgi:hypothetical protein
MIVVCAVIASQLVASPGRAGAAADPAEKEAQQLLNEGVAARTKGDSNKALQLFKRAEEVRPSMRALAQMGLASSDLSLWRDAARYLDNALASVDDVWVNKHRKDLEQARAAVGKHLGKLFVKVPADAAVFVNGVAIPEDDRTGGTLLVPEGSATIVVRKAGFLDFSKSVEVQGGTEEALDVDLVPDRRALPSVAAETATAVAAVTAPAAAAPTEPAGWRKPAGIALLAVGAASVATGVVLLVMDGRPTCDAPAGKMCSNLYDTKGVGIAALAGGAAAGAVGGWFLFRGSKEDGGPSVALQLGGLLGVQASGRF